MLLIYNDLPSPASLVPVMHSGRWRICGLNRGKAPLRMSSRWASQKCRMLPWIGEKLSNVATASQRVQGATLSLPHLHSATDGTKQRGHPSRRTCRLHMTIMAGRLEKAKGPSEGNRADSAPSSQGELSCNLPVRCR